MDDMERGKDMADTAGNGGRRELKYHAKVRVYYQEGHFGPGMATLMGLVRDTGSLTAACREMNMAYSKAWKMVKKAEQDLGFLLMEGRRGGEKGGNTVLTDKGEEFLLEYEKFAEEIKESIASIFDKHFDKYR